MEQVNLSDRTVTLSAEDAAHVIDDVRRTIAGLKCLKVLADKGDVNAKELLRQWQEVNRSLTIRLL